MKFYHFLYFIFLLPLQSFTQNNPFKVGDTGPGGGIIFYDKGDWVDDWRYLEANTTDGPSRNYGQGRDNNTTNTIGSGLRNTLNMSDYQNDYNYSISMKTDGGKRGWYIPNKIESQNLYYYKRDNGNDKLNLQSGWYWTSHQNDKSNDVNNLYAQQIEYVSGFTRGEGKQYVHKTRLIRRVTIDDIEFKENKSIYLDGNLFFTLENTSIYQRADHNYYRSISLWIKPEETGKILSMYQNFDIQNSQYFLSYDKVTESFQFAANGTANSDGYNSAHFGNVPSNNWYHLVVVVNYVSNGNSELTAYINGVPQLFQDGNTTFEVNVSQASANLPLYIGGFQGEVSTFQGHIDDLTIWGQFAYNPQRGLSQSEVTSIYNITPVENQIRVNGYYDFNSNSNLIIEDLSKFTFDISGSESFNLEENDAPYQYEYKPLNFGFLNQNTGSYETSIDFTENSNTLYLNDLSVLYPGYDPGNLIFSFTGENNDNADFNLVGNTINFNTDPDYETKTSYIIHVQVTDGVHVLEKEFTVNILDSVDDLPEVTNLSLNEITLSDNGGVSILSATIDVVSLNDISIPLSISGTASINEDYSISFASEGTASIYSGANGIGSDVNQLNQPEGIAIDSNGDVYIADYNNNRVQKTNNSTRVVSTFIDNISNPVDIHIDSLGNIFILENNGTVKKYDSLGVFISVVSNGTDSNAINMDIDNTGNIYTITRYGTKVWKTTTNNSTASVLFDDSEFNFPNSVSVDSSGNVYVSGQNQPVRIWNKSTNTSTTLNGTDGSRAITINDAGNLLVAQESIDITGRNATVKEYKLPNINQNNYETVFSQNSITDDYYMGISAIKSSNKNLFVAISKDAIQSGSNYNNVLKDRVLIIANAPNILIPAGAISGIISFTSIGESLVNEIGETIIITPSNPYNTDPLNSLTPKTITILSVNDLPIAIADELTVLEDAEITSIDVVANDTDADTEDTLVLTGATPDGLGTVTLDDNGISINYQPALNFNGTEIITYTISDGTDETTGTLTIIVSAVNDAPIAVADTSTIDEDADLTSIDVVTNDDDVDEEDVLTLMEIGDVSNGEATINGDGISIDYKPNLNFNGTETITYTIYDGTVETTGNLTITITAVNDLPVITDDDVEVDEGGTVTILSNTQSSILDNDLDIENDALTLVLIDATTSGALVLNSDGSFSYTHDGSEIFLDSFTYIVNDGFGDSDIGTVSIVIKPLNDNSPTDIILSNTYIDENLTGVSIGNLTSVDLDNPNDNHTFELVNGDGDTDNSSFTIIGNELINSEFFDYENKESHLIRLKVADEEGQSFQKTFTILVVNINDIDITSEKVDSYCSGSFGSGLINITSISNSFGQLNFNWTSSNGGIIPVGQEDNQNLTDLSDGIYSLTLSDDDFTFTETFEISLIPQYDELSICYVSSDENDREKNRIFLNNEGNYNVDIYEILRETNQSDVYESIGTLEYNEDSFLDDTANNTSQTYNYKVRSLDNCENTSSESIPHKTILLQSSIALNNSVNLSWTDYEGTNYSTYTIYKKTNQGSFEEIGSVSSSNNSYNDQTADVFNNNYEYYIAIGVDACNVQAKNNTSIEIKSNIQNISSATATVADENYFKNLRIYPNPTKNMLFIRGNELPVQITIYNILGQELISVKNTNKIDLQYLSTGVYTVKVSDGIRQFKRKFIKD